MYITYDIYTYGYLYTYVHIYTRYVVRFVAAIRQQVDAASMAFQGKEGPKSHHAAPWRSDNLPWKRRNK